MSENEKDSVKKIPNQDLTVLLTKALERLSSSDTASLLPESKKDALKRHLEIYQKKHQFTVGQIVRWKPGMKNRKFPDLLEPAIVIQVLEKPITDSSLETGSPYFGEQLDLVLGMISDDGDFLTYYHAGARFEPFD